MAWTTRLAVALAAGIVTTTAHAEPGLGAKVYGAGVTKGESEFEAIYGRLSGGAGDGEDVLKLEAAHGVTDRLQLGLMAEFEREPQGNRKLEAFGAEAIYALGHVGPIALAAYGEYEIVAGAPDKIETKLLMQHLSGPWDLRFNLIAEKELASAHRVELEYAASADVETFGEVRLGVQAFGKLGSFAEPFPHTEHFAGPVAKVEIEGLGPELVIEAGYLFALGAARDETDGQMRLAVELEF